MEIAPKPCTAIAYAHNFAFTLPSAPGCAALGDWKNSAALCSGPALLGTHQGAAELQEGSGALCLTAGMAWSGRVVDLLNCAFSEQDMIRQT